ncbi:hypothetical protein [Neobacillus niacini]|uniref:hypothetical protein n=1 Tax=Neobacillus niacini TaxID=86668 RepID=UPI002FFF3344
MSALKRSTKEKIIIANEPMISKIGPKKLKNDTSSTLINTKPDSIAAKNNKINSIVISHPFSLKYVFKCWGDWIIDGLLQNYDKKKQTNNQFGLQ